MNRVGAAAPSGDVHVTVHYLRIGEWPLELALDDADRAYVAEARRGSVALRRATSRFFARRALAHELELSEGGLTIHRDRLGRPHLEQETGVDFSVSTSDALVAVAISRSRRVGLDIEPEHRLVRMAAGGRGEPRASGAHGPAARRLRCWTLREAYLKEVGVGLLVPAGALSVGVGTRPSSGCVEACSFGVARSCLHTLRAQAPREYASFLHAGHLWAIVCRGRLARGLVSVRRWTAGVPRLECEQPLSSRCKVEVR